ncbi:MAG: UDP-N-acetylmuramoyl-L-alanine--D-glutamate ligase [Phycisphaerae bacterium]|jgi:UDP-N-acetylmuramoylalanine--D-glutamate ligase
MIADFKHKRVTVMGLGRFAGGVGVTRWLAAQGARLLVTDTKPLAELGDSIAQIADCGAKLRLGGHREQDFVETDLVVVNPAVPDSSPFLGAARRAGVEVTTEMNLFVERCPARTVGVTGSVGKSTVTAMIGHVLERTLADARVWVGGNLGRSLLDALGQIAARDVVVLELSSFQLQRTPLVCWSPQVAVLTGVTPNHLDWHGTFAAYLAAKLNIVRFQDAERSAFILHDDPGLRRHVELMFGDVSGVWRYGLDGDEPRALLQETAAVDCDTQRVTWPGVRLGVPGRHNLENAAAALTAAHVLGVDPRASAAAISTYKALPHRLQRVAVRGGVAYYNDSKSTTPESAITAMNAIDAPLLVILGGYDKGIDLSPAARLAAQRAKFAACIGQTGRQIVDLIRQAGGQADFFDGLPEALAACRARAAVGDAVLLSPACASWGMFSDYRQRGDEFSRLAQEAPD